MISDSKVQAIKCYYYNNKVKKIVNTFVSLAVIVVS